MKSLKNSYSQAVSKFEPFEHKGHLKLWEAWEKIATDKAKAHIDNIVMSKKNSDEICVYVDSPHWVAELSMNKQYYKKAFSELLNFEVKNVLFLITKSENYIIKNNQEDDIKPSYIDDWDSIKLGPLELAEIKIKLSGIDNEKLRESLFSAIVSDLEWKKGNPDLKTS